jgi:hypothetical protein
MQISPSKAHYHQKAVAGGLTPSISKIQPIVRPNQATSIFHLLGFSKLKMYVLLLYLIYYIYNLTLSSDKGLPAGNFSNSEAWKNEAQYSNLARRNSRINGCNRFTSYHCPP